MSKPRHRPGRLPMTAGALLMAAALALGVYNITESNRAAKEADQALSQLLQRLPEQAPLPGPGSDPGSPELLPQSPAYVQHPDMAMPIETVGKWDYVGTLQIPALGLELPILDQCTDRGLKKAPCRYGGSAYKDDLILAGHNYTSHFGRLTRLKAGDTVTFTDLDGNSFTYAFLDRQDLQPGQVEEMGAGDWDLTLFTCTVSGQARIAFRFVKSASQ